MNSRTLPLIAFALLIALLMVGLTIADRKELIPSPLINKPVPAFDLPVLGNPQQRLSNESMLGKPYLVNFWASWCVTCVAEHPVVTALANANKLTVLGMNFRDEREDAMSWLNQHGDPYDIILRDSDGRISIDFGVYAAPESFLVNPEGIIVFKQTGALTPEVVQNEILPRVAAMQGGQQ